MLGRDISPQELVVAKGDSTRSNNAYYILVKLADLNDDTCLDPLVGMWGCLVLNMYVVANCKRWLTPGVLCPLLSFFHVPVPKDFLSGCLSVTPGGVRYIAAGKYGYKVLDRSAKYTPSR